MHFLLTTYVNFKSVIRVPSVFILIIQILFSSKIFKKKIVFQTY